MSIKGVVACKGFVWGFLEIRMPYLALEERTGDLPLSASAGHNEICPPTQPPPLLL